MSTRFVVALVVVWVGFWPLTRSAGLPARSVGESTATIPPIGVVGQEAPAKAADATDTRPTGSRLTTP